MLDAGALLGRVLLGAIFLWFGFVKATTATATTAYFAKLGLPIPVLAFGITVAIELGVGILFVIGLFGRTSALILAFWCIATAIVAHSNFADRNMLINFLKNVAMCGGFIYAALLGPGRFSLDVFRGSRQA